MNARIALSLSLAVFGACATDDADVDTDTEHAQTAPGKVASIATPLFDQLGKAECGNGRVATPVAQQMELRWLAASCQGPNEIQLDVDGVPVVRTQASGACSCMPGIRSARITDPSILKMIDGTVTLRVAAPGATLLAWAEVVILDQNGAHEFTVFDQDGPSSSAEAAENLCLASSTENGIGVIEVQFGEQCDDGNTIDGDGCSATCTKE